MDSWQRTFVFLCSLGITAVLGMPCAKALSTLDVLSDDAEVVLAATIAKRGYQSGPWAHVPRVMTGSSAIVWWYAQFLGSKIPFSEQLRPRRSEVIDVITWDGSWIQGTTQVRVQIRDDMHVCLSLLPYPTSRPTHVAYAKSENTIGWLDGVLIMSLESMHELLESRLRELNLQRILPEDWPEPADWHEAEEKRRLAIRKAEHDIVVLTGMTRVYHWFIETLNSDTPQSVYRMGRFWEEKSTLEWFFSRYRSL